jgi:putative transposase
VKLPSFTRLVFVPKYRRKILYGKTREYLRDVLKELSRQRGCEILEGNLRPDHVHMLIRIPPKYSISEVVGYMKGKSAIAVARQFSGRQRNFNGESLWARGYAVSTVGFEESIVRKYIQNQEENDARRDEGKF